ncbi:peptidyl-prolyl cis-trans isomerase CYP59 isoform X1 [Senna tora]|uniref:Peptidyl-prolyl cis-trans isomerase n=1 Tax=Senna tora TaxID=362788 RepID=A0A834WP78_9FABA|nr:peptidyl-prolyl cis-trans isomerase CYP59 isoform X1 [Senna tora]
MERSLIIAAVEKDVSADRDQLRRPSGRSIHRQVPLDMQKFLEALQKSFKSINIFVSLRMLINLAMAHKILYFVPWIKYYNGCLFHTVQKDFTAQTGDPTGIGSGGDSIYKFLYGDQARFFSDEIHIDLKHSKTGTVAMASAGENLNASQFYITLRDNLDYLDGKHTVFGEVAEGLETLTRINEAYVDEKGRPYKNIRIKHTYILDDPFDDPPQLTEFIPDASPEGKPKDEIVDEVRLEDDWVPMDEQLDPTELEEVIRAKEAHSRAVVLESIGDIPDAEIKPPDNVLFVCKLNPVTEDDDLHTIFSRFGTVVSAEIIRDHKTGDSLCYAFIEFENQQACEQAYFKMDNALIDDRRIHVDFSQSVAKLWSQYRRKGQSGNKGCFKCGSSDHVAKDCTEDAKNQQSAKYILKDDNAQRGGENMRYEMVFDGDQHESRSPRQGTKRRGHDRDDLMERKSKMVGSDNKDRYGDRSKGRYERSTRDSDYHAERKDRSEKHTERHRGDDYGRKDDRDSRKKNVEDSHVERRTSGDYRRKTDSSHGERRVERESGRDDGDKRKKNGTADDDSHEDKRRMDDRDHRKRHEDRGRQHVNNESRGRKRSPDDADYRRQREERGHRRDLEFNDDRHRRHHSRDRR